MVKKINFVKFGLIVAIFFMMAASLPLVSASCPAQFTGTVVTSSTLRELHPSGELYRYSAFGIGFKPNVTDYLYSVTFQIKKDGSPLGAYAAYLYNSTGTFGSGAVPTGSPLDTSYWEDVSELAGSYLPIEFDFHGSYELQVDEEYFICLVIVEADYFDAYNHVELGLASGYTGNGAYYKNNAWYATPAYEPPFEINAGDTPLATATPTPTAPPSATPTPTPVGDTGNEFIYANPTVAAFVNLLVPLLLIILPMVICYKLMGGIGAFVGLNVGVILWYIVIPETFPMGAFVLIGIVDVILLVYGKKGD